MFVVVVVIGYEVVGTKENKLHYNILQFSPSFQCWGLARFKSLCGIM